MSKYKSILVAIDLNGGGEALALAAKEFSTNPDVKFIVVSVCYPISPLLHEYSLGDIYTSSEPEKIEDKIKAESESQLQELMASVGIADAHFIVEFGRPTDTILDIANKNHTDLIIVGTHGRHGFSRLIGSTANGILNRAHCDTMAVRTDTPESLEQPE